MELQYTYKLFNWSSFVIKDVPGLHGTDMTTYDYYLEKEKLQSMGIVCQDSNDTVLKNGTPMNLRAGHSKNLRTGLCNS